MMDPRFKNLKDPKNIKRIFDIKEGDKILSASMVILDAEFRAGAELVAHGSECLAVTWKTKDENGHRILRFVSRVRYVLDDKPALESRDVKKVMVDDAIIGDEIPDEEAVLAHQAYFTKTIQMPMDKSLNPDVDLDFYPIRYAKFEEIKSENFNDLIEFLESSAHVKVVQTAPSRN